MDIFKKLETPQELTRFQHFAEGYYIYPQLEGELGARMMFQGKEMICWSINNYLGMANDPEIRRGDTAAMERWGMAHPMGARVMTGDAPLHRELEAQLAEFSQKEAALLVNFGYQGIVSSIDALVGRRDVVVYDSESHACIIDGIRLLFGKSFVYKHNDMESLEKNLQRAQKEAEKKGGGILVISEGVFGMSGDQGKLVEIVELKKKYEFRLYIDDAHGFGTLGANGRGAGEEQGVQDEIDVYFSTFAKSMASVGAFFSGKKYIIEHLRYNMRSQVFAKSLPSATVEGIINRLEMLKNKPEMKEKLWENVNMLQSGLRDLGLKIGNTNSCVTPVYLEGSIEEATHLTKDLRDNFNVFCSIVVYPVVPKGVMILRLIPTAAHSKEDVQITLDAFAQISKKLKNKEYNQEEYAYV